VILTNATLLARNLLPLHNGRGAQEAIFAELKCKTQMDYIPCRRGAANQTWLLSAIMANNTRYTEGRRHLSTLNVQPYFQLCKSGHSVSVSILFEGETRDFCSLSMRDGPSHPS